MSNQHLTNVARPLPGRCRAPTPTVGVGLRDPAAIAVQCCKQRLHLVWGGGEWLRSECHGFTHRGYYRVSQAAPSVRQTPRTRRSPWSTSAMR